LGTPAEVIILGLGPAGAAAARLLHRLGRSLILVDAPTERPFDPCILLPPSAMEALDFLSVRRRVEAAGVAVEDVQLRWGGGGETRTQAGLRVREGALSALLREGIELPHHRQRVQGLILEGDRVCGVRLADGRALRAALTLCSVPALVDELLPPLAVGPTDLASSTRLPVPTSRFAHRQHLLESNVDGWAWAVRWDDEQLQYTWFSAPDDEAATLPAAGRDLGLGVAPDLWFRRPVRPSLPSAATVPGLMPFGRAAYAVHPLSSLGVSQALRSAQLTATAANTRFQSTRDEQSLQEWLVRAQLTEALRAHALTTLAFSDASQLRGGSYWRARSDPRWYERALPDELVRMARRSLEIQALQRAGSLFSTPFLRTGPLQRGPLLVPRGPMVRSRDGWTPPGGLPMATDEWDRERSLIDAFATPTTLEALMHARQTPEPAQRALVQRICRLYELGFIEALV
jgi:2-polyprenyl-6-methoxyphenol hydroxylase-like FAD-dependent oxidoreductase